MSLLLTLLLRCFFAAYPSYDQHSGKPPCSYGPTVQVSKWQADDARDDDERGEIRGIDERILAQMSSLDGLFFPYKVGTLPGLSLHL